MDFFHKKEDKTEEKNTEDSVDKIEVEAQKSGEEPKDVKEAEDAEKTEETRETEEPQKAEESSGTEESEREKDSKKEEEAKEEESKKEEEAGEKEEAEKAEVKKTEKSAKHHRGRREPKKHRGLKAIGVTFGVVVILAAVVYFGIALFFHSHFLFYTKINGVNSSLKSVSQVEDYMDQQVSDYVLTLQESDGTTETIKGSDISTKYVPGDQLTELVEAQDVLLWPKSLVDHPEIEATIGVTYDEEALAEVISKLDCTQEDNEIPSENAVPVLKDSEVVIEPEVIGTELDIDVFTEAVNTAVNGFQDSLNLEKEDCYILPEYVSTSPEVEEAAEKMKKYLSAEITYDMSPDQVVVGASEIEPWVKVDRKTEEVSLKQGSVKDFISELADKYDTYGHEREFKTAKGKTVTVSGGSYGWQIDQDEETEALLSDIRDGNVVEREPAYSHTARSHGSQDIGDTYAEVDLSGQHMYYTKDGKVVLDSDVVTGNPNKGNATPQGTYTIMYKELDATLKGDIQPDGSYGYETPVKYWMPFNGGIGFHDATWQSSFGGDRYLTHGSHGCVNMPKDKAEQLYSLISTGDPVICYN